MKEEEEKKRGEGCGGRKVNKEALEAGEEVGTERGNRIVDGLTAVMVFKRVYVLDIKTVMLVLLTQLCELLPLLPFLWFNSPTSPHLPQSPFTVKLFRRPLTLLSVSLIFLRLQYSEGRCKGKNGWVST
jgi:hypothetical protein